MTILKKTKNKFNQTLIKVYFVILILAYILLFISFEPTSNWYINFPFLILNFIAFFGFAWNKKIFNQLFWKIVFVLGFTLKIGSVIMYVFNSNLLEQLNLSYVFIFFIQFLLPVFFRFIPFYLYAFKSKGIWSSDSNNIIIFQ